MFKPMENDKPSIVPFPDDQLFSLGMVVAFCAAGSFDGGFVFDNLCRFLVEGNAFLDQSPLAFGEIIDVSAQAHSA